VLIRDRLVSSVGVGWDWCDLYGAMDEENVEAGGGSLECSKGLKSILSIPKRCG